MRLTAECDFKGQKERGIILMSNKHLVFQIVFKVSVSHRIRLLEKYHHNMCT